MSQDSIVSEGRIDMKEKKNFFQLDIMKSLMILLVIVDHSTTHSLMHQYYSPLWERIAIPLFMVIMGFNMGNSFKNKGNYSLKELYSKEYFISRIKRYALPYVIIYMIHSILYLITTFGGVPTLQNFPYDSFEQIYIGYTPFWGPGMWFMPVIFTSILIFPLIYKLFTKSPVLTLLLCFGLEIGMHLILSFVIPTYHPTGGFFSNHILYMLSGIGLGLWLTRDHDILSKRNIFYWILFPISLGIVLIDSIYGFSALNTMLDMIGLGWINGDYNLLFFPYSAFLFLIGMKILPKNPNGKISNFIRRVSKSTYHILLTQILYFSIVYHFFFQMYDWYSYGPFIFDGSPLNYLWYFPLNVVITFSIGMLWYELEQRFYIKVNKHNSFKILYYILFGMGCVFLLVRFITQFVFFNAFPF